MEPIEISPRPTLPPYAVTMLPEARPQFFLVPLWTKEEGRPAIAVDDDGQPIMLLNVRSQEGGPQVVINIPLTAANRAQLVDLLRQSVRADELRLE